MDSTELREAFHFLCSMEFWRMAIFWTLSLIISYLQLFCQRFLFAKKPKSSMHSSPPVLPQATKSTIPSATDALRTPICIITGATSGLGAATANALSSEGFYIVLAGRSSDLLAKAISAIKKQNAGALVKAFEVDISSFQSVLSFKNSLEQWLLESNMHSSVQLLINNAGILAKSSRLTPEDCDQMMATNYIGAFCLTKVLLPLLENSPVPSRVINVTSFTHRNVSSVRVDKDTVTGKCFTRLRCYPCAQIYEYSKFCLLLFSYELHRQIGLMEKSHQLLFFKQCKQWWFLIANLHFGPPGDIVPLILEQSKLILCGKFLPTSHGWHFSHSNFWEFCSHQKMESLLFLMLHLHLQKYQVFTILEAMMEPSDLLHFHTAPDFQKISGILPVIFT